MRKILNSLAVLALLISITLYIPGQAQAAIQPSVPVIASTTSTGEQFNDFSMGGKMSGDGRYVLLLTPASNTGFIEPSSSPTEDIFVKDMITGELEAVTVRPDGVLGNESSWIGGISNDGRYVLFSSYASDLVPNDTNEKMDVFVRDLQLNTTEAITDVSDNGYFTHVRFDKGDTIISGDGRYVVYQKIQSNILGQPLYSSLIVKDRLLNIDKAIGDTYYQGIDMSNDGRWLTYDISVCDLDCKTQIILYDLQTDTREVLIDSVVRDENGQYLDQAQQPSISDDGRFIAYSNGNGATDRRWDIYLFDRNTGTSSLKSVGTNGEYAEGFPDELPRLSSDANRLVWIGDGSLGQSAFGNNVSLFKDLQTGQITDLAPIPPDSTTGASHADNYISADGSTVTIWSYSGDYTPGDTNGFGDILYIKLTDQPSYNFSGFYQPIDNPPILNTLKAGKSTPIRFSLGGDFGLNIFAAGYPYSRPVTCNNSTTSPAEEIDPVDVSGLVYDSTNGRYTFRWQTNNNWTGCRELVVKFKDGSIHTILFSFR